jgi:hypothetical protein
MPVDEQFTEIRIALRSAEMLRVFGPFADNVASAIAEEQTDEGAVAALVGRYTHWRRLFAGEPAGGLGRDDALGLWGEIWVLRHVLHPIWGRACVAAWTGYEPDNKDFRRGRLTVETKTTGSDTPLMVRINGARQLDLGDSDTLLLAVLEVETHREGSGETLVETVQDARAVLDPAAVEQLDLRLDVRGYHDSEAELYASVRYSLRKERWYDVQGEFPRITPSDLRDGVGALRYALSVDACTPWHIDEVQRNSVLRREAPA